MLEHVRVQRKYLTGKRNTLRFCVDFCANLVEGKNDNNVLNDILFLIIVNIANDYEMTLNK